MIGSKLFPNVVTQSAIAWWTMISWGPALADQVVLMHPYPANVNNEAEQEFGGNHDPGFVVRNSDLEMGYERVEGYGGDPGEGNTPSRIALRYEGIAIPPGATITGAHIQFMADDEPDKTTFNPPPDPELGIPGTFAPLEASFSIYGYLNPVTPANAPPLPANSGIPLATKYTLTDLTGGQCANPVGNCAGATGPKGGIGSEIINVTAPVHWVDIPTWSTGDANHNGVAEPELGEYGHIGGTVGPDQRTPDLKSIVQHIVDLPGWASGNAMTFFIDPMVEVAGTVPGIDDDTFYRGSRVAVAILCGPAANRCLEIKAQGITPMPPVLTIDFTTDTGPDGDYNEDGAVDAADYVAWRKNPADFGGDPAGYNLWRQHFAEGGPGAGASGAVPEPGCYALIVSIVVASLLARTRSVH